MATDVPSTHLNAKKRVSCEEVWLSAQQACQAVYTISQNWAEAVHAADPRWDGMLYVSRQNNLLTAVALFERSGVTKASARKLGKMQLDELCDRYNVLLV
jgi:hypothetical protein